MYAERKPVAELINYQRSIQIEKTSLEHFSIRSTRRKLVFLCFS